MVDSRLEPEKLRLAPAADKGAATCAILQSTEIMSLHADQTSTSPGAVGVFRPLLNVLNRLAAYRVRSAHAARSAHVAQLATRQRRVQNRLLGGRTRFCSMNATPSGDETLQYGSIHGGECMSKFLE